MFAFIVLCMGWITNYTIHSTAQWATVAMIVQPEAYTLSTYYAEVFLILVVDKSFQLNHAGVPDNLAKLCYLLCTLTVNQSLILCKPNHRLRPTMLPH